FVRLSQCVLDQLLPILTLQFETNCFGNVLYAMDDVDNLAVFIENRRVHRAPITLFKAPALGRWAADVVFLDRHRVCHAGFEDTGQRCPEVADAISRLIVWVVGKYLEKSSTQDVASDRHRCSKVSIADSGDSEVRQQNKKQSWR